LGKNNLKIFFFFQKFQNNFFFEIFEKRKIFFFNFLFLHHIFRTVCIWDFFSGDIYKKN